MYVACLAQSRVHFLLFSPVCRVQFLLGGVGEDRGTEGRDAILNPGFPFSAFRLTSPLGFSSITTPTRRRSPVSSSEFVPCPSFASSLLQLFQHHGAFFSLKPFATLNQQPLLALLGHDTLHCNIWSTSPGVFSWVP